jgi:hypothetical protein
MLFPPHGSPRGGWLSYGRDHGGEEPRDDWPTARGKLRPQADSLWGSKSCQPSKGAWKRTNLQWHHNQHINSVFKISRTEMTAGTVLSLTPLQYLWDSLAVWWTPGVHCSCHVVFHSQFFYSPVDSRAVSRCYAKHRHTFPSISEHYFSWKWPGVQRSSRLLSVHVFSVVAVDFYQSVGAHRSPSSPNTGHLSVVF